MYLIIDNYANKVSDEKDTRFNPPWFKVMTGVYELKHRSCYGILGGFTSVENWQKSVMERSDFQGFTPEGQAIYDGKKFYGIHSYQLVYLSEIELESF